MLLKKQQFKAHSFQRIDANGDRQLRTLGPDCHILVLVLVLPLGFGQQDYALREKRKHANA